MGEWPVVDKPREARFPDMEWFLDNFDDMVKLYDGEWVAISGRRVVAHSRSINTLRKELELKGVDRPFITRASLEAWRPVR